MSVWSKIYEWLKKDTCAEEDECEKDLPKLTFAFLWSLTFFSYLVYKFDTSIRGVFVIAVLFLSISSIFLVRGIYIRCFSRKRNVEMVSTQIQLQAIT